MDQILDSWSKLTGDKDIAQFEYKNRIRYSNYRLHEREKLVVPILPNGNESNCLNFFEYNILIHQRRGKKSIIFRFSFWYFVKTIEWIYFNYLLKYSSRISKYINEVRRNKAWIKSRKLTTDKIIYICSFFSVIKTRSIRIRVFIKLLFLLLLFLLFLFFFLLLYSLLFFKSLQNLSFNLILSVWSF